MDHKCYIFDGFPRNLEQAQLFEDRLLRGRAYQGLYFNVSMEVLLERLEGRRVCRDCGAVYHLSESPPRREGICDHCESAGVEQRSDDQRDVISNRLSIYNNTVWPLLNYYRSHKVLREVAADGPPDEVFERLLRALG